MSNAHPNWSAPVWKLIILTFFMASTLSTGCQLAPPLPSPTATLLPTNTPEPTSTSTPTPTATPDRTATAIVHATETMSARLTEIFPDFVTVGYTARRGSLVFDYALPIRLTVNSYGSYLVEPIFTTPLQDFILHVDVKWDMSKSDSGGCGIMFRAEDNLERGAQYVFMIDHYPFTPKWGVMYRKFNQTQNPIIKMKFEKLIEDDPNSTNKIMLVVTGDIIQAYINGKKLIEGSYSKLSEGGIAFFTYQVSGESTCTFENIWIWELPPN